MKSIRFFIMSILVIIIQLQNIFCNNNSQFESDSAYFYHILLDNIDFRFNLSFYISTPDYTGKVVNHSLTLFKVLKKAKFVYNNSTMGNDTLNISSWKKEKKEYIRYMHNLLMNKDTLKVDFTILTPDPKLEGIYTGFKTVGRFDDIESISNQGKDKFLNKYFIQHSEEYGELKENIFEKFKDVDKIKQFLAAIVDKLFELRIYSSNHKPGGNLIYFDYKTGLPLETKKIMEDALLE